jgi:hypothetical protein
MAAAFSALAAIVAASKRVIMVRSLRRFRVLTSHFGEILAEGIST